MTETSAALTLDVTLGKAMFSASGGSEHVLQAFSDFQALVSLPPAALASSVDESTEETSTPSQAVAPTPASATEPDQEERIPLPVFLSSKVTKGNNMIALGIGVWAKRYDDVDAVDAETAKNYWRASGMKVPGNISRDLGTATTAGWFEKRGRAFFVTSYGERFFDDLPSKEK